MRFFLPKKNHFYFQKHLQMIKTDQNAVVILACLKKALKRKEGYFFLKTIVYTFGSNTGSWVRWPFRPIHLIIIHFLISADIFSDQPVVLKYIPHCICVAPSVFRFHGAI